MNIESEGENTVKTHTNVLLVLLSNTKSRVSITIVILVGPRSYYSITSNTRGPTQ